MQAALERHAGTQVRREKAPLLPASDRRRRDRVVRHDGRLVGLQSGSGSAWAGGGGGAWPMSGAHGVRCGSGVFSLRVECACILRVGLSGVLLVLTAAFIISSRD